MSENLKKVIRIQDAKLEEIREALDGRMIMQVIFSGSEDFVSLLLDNNTMVDLSGTLTEQISFDIYDLELE